MSDSKTARTYNDSWGDCRAVRLLSPWPATKRHHSNSMIFKAACFGRGRLPMPPRTLPFALMIGTLVAI